MKVAHTITHHECEQCNLKFDNTIKYEYHMKSHDITKQYKCKMCEKTFLQHSHVLIHERTHTGFRPYLCSTCGKGMVVPLLLFF